MAAEIGIVGGTFDPIHTGHLAMAEGLRDRYGLAEVWFMPAGTPPHKAGRQRMTDAHHRLAMVRLAIAGNPHFLCSTVEMELPGPSWTVRTVERLQQLYPEQRFCFITGADSVLQIETWREYRRLLGMIPFLAASRPRYARGAWLDVADRLGPELAAQVTFAELPGLDIASSELRSLMAEGRSIRYLVPDSVYAYIQTHGLYEVGRSGGGE